MKISVVIPTGGRWPLLQQCLASVLAQDRRPDEVLVIDNSLGGMPYPSSLPDGVRLVRETRRGVVHARNRGLDEARGEVLAFLDDDCLAPPGWLTAVENCFVDPAVAAAGGPARPVWLAPPPPPILRSPRILSYLGLQYFGPNRKPLETPFEYLMGGNLAIRASALASGKRFVSVFPFPGAGQCAEDTEMVRSLAARHTVLYEPAAWIQHQISPDKIRWRSLIVRVFCMEAAGARLSRGSLFPRRPDVLGLLLKIGLRTVQFSGRLFGKCFSPLG